MMNKKVLFPLIILMITFNSSVHSDPLWIFFKSENGRKTGDPVSRQYIENIKNTGAKIRTVSRYLNAVSVEWDGEGDFFRLYGFVDKVSPVRSFRDRKPMTAGKTASYKKQSSNSAYKLNYGFSLRQLELIGVPALHEKGLTGAGVVIGVLDSGFDTEGPESLQQLNITHRRNFISGGENVYTGDYHGTNVLGCIAGKQDGVFYGPAFGAEFLLAVTENVNIESRTEEDNWVAAMEWCDSLGADIISSSVVYDFGHDDLSEDYKPSEMDGKTSLIAQAAEIAASRGIIVVSSAGNEGEAFYNDNGVNRLWRIVATPGDAPNVIAVGAVSMPEEGTPVIAPFSSRGPTADGRTKPDLVAPGVDIVAPFYDRINDVQLILVTSGSSFSTPLVSGLCALLLEAHPGLTPAQMSGILKSTAIDLGETGPDNDYGWGLPDGLAAYNGLVASVNGGEKEKTENSMPEVFRLGIPNPNPFNSSVTIPVDILKETPLEIYIYDITGRKAATLFDGVMIPGQRSFTWDAPGMSSGIYIIRASSEKTMISRKILLVK